MLYTLTGFHSETPCSWQDKRAAIEQITVRKTHMYMFWGCQLGIVAYVTVTQCAYSVTCKL